MISIRSEKPGDIPAIRQVVSAAFSASEFGDNGEADLVDALRTNCDRCLSLVAVSNEAQVVGHILFSPATIVGDSIESRGMALAPMAVAPGLQGTGVGTALINFGLRQLSDIHCPFVFVLGHPDYYPRFGFLPALEFQVTHGFAGIPQSLFFLKLLDSNVKTSICDGAAHYHSTFGPQHIE